MTTVHIIDVESGNLQSLRNAIEILGFDVKIVKSASDPELAKAERLLLPGVGNFGHFVDNLTSRGFEKPIREYIASGKPIMGICVGLQCLFEGSMESPESVGLGYLDLKLTKFDATEKPVPAIGWNTCVPQENLFGLDPCNRYYFVHSYAAIFDEKTKSRLENAGWNIAAAKYGSQEYIAAIAKGNIFATQFHPEKSGKAGLKILKNFITQVHPSIEHSEKENKLLQNDYSNYGLTRRIIACLDVRTNDQGDLVVTRGDQYDVREKEDGCLLYTSRCV